MINHSMRIAQLSTPFISVPPVTYGGIELVVHHLTEGLVANGHQVTLFAPGDSKTTAKLVAPFDKALDKETMLKLFSPLADKLLWLHSLPAIYHAVAAFEKEEKFDLIHNHLHYIGNLLALFVDIPVVHTYHGDFISAMDSAIERMILQKCKDQPFVAISKSQKRNCPLPLNFVEVIHHGVELDKFSFSSKGGDYLVWLGRVTEKKGIIEAIKVAKETRHKLVISGFVKPREEEFFKQEVLPLVDGQEIVLQGPVDFEGKVGLFKNAKALLYPIGWEEPFGLVMVEAMACGTPVIAYERGSVPELVVDGETGYIIKVQSSKFRVQSSSSKFKIQSGRLEVESGKGEVGSEKSEGKIRDMKSESGSQSAKVKSIIKDTGLKGLLAAVERLYAMPQEKYRAMRQAARRRVEKYFTVEKMVAKYEEVYKRLVAG